MVRQPESTNLAIDQLNLSSKIYADNTDRMNAASKLNEKLPQKQIRLCAHCGKPIVSNALKALGRYYHDECLVCHDCGVVCKPKYYPYEDPESKEMILLCQKHYFTRNNLLCYVCNEPLKGVYFSTFGKMYDEEHFCCSICGEKCQVDACFHDDNKLYCRYHFLKNISRRCKGCQYPISDQYIEFQRGEELECWHTECYGIHKYWHVTIGPEAFGLPILHKQSIPSKPSHLHSDPSLEQIEKNIKSLNSILSKIWTVLYRFEEETAACISDMFQYLTSYDQSNGLHSAALFVLKVECLFKALDSLEAIDAYSPNSPKETQYSEKIKQDSSYPGSIRISKFSKNLSTKIMNYLQLLRKLSHGSDSVSDVNVNSFMSVITALAQFLKLIIRQSLSNALDCCKTARSSTAMMKFLREIEKNEAIYQRPFDFINVTIEATDSCQSCKKYIKNACIQYSSYRWHQECLKCDNCQKKINAYGLEDSSFNKSKRSILCAKCSADDPESKVGFKTVSNSSQLVFLLKIALVRSKTVMEYNKPVDPLSKNMRETISMQQTYIRTLNDIKRLKSRRTSMRISHNKQEARKSKIIETQEMDVGYQDGNNKDLIIETEPTGSVNNQTVFDGTRSLTLDDISRIVAAEQARDLRPNAFAHFKTLKEENNETLITKKSGVYYSELSAAKYYKLQIIALTLLIDEGFTSDPNKYPVPLQKTTSGNGSFWVKFKTIMSGKENRKFSPEKVFNIPLDYLTLHCGVDSDLGIGPSKLKVPVLVDELLSNLRQLDMSTEGVFRKNGNIRRLRELAEDIDKNPNSCPNLSKENAIQLSALLKKFLRELPVPLLTTEWYQMWIRASKIEDEIRKQRIVALLYTMLPLYHRNVAEVLFSFLYWASSFSHVDNQIGSKMDIHNISTVIAPNILYQPTSTSSKVNPVNTKPPQTYNDAFAQNEGEEYFLAIETVDYIINHNEELSMVPKYMLVLLDELEANKVEKAERISSFVRKKLSDKSIDLQDYSISSPQVKESVTKVKMNE